MTEQTKNRAKRILKLFSIKRYLPRTLFARSLLILITPIFLIQVISSYVFFDRHWVKMTTRLASAVAGEIAWAASSIEDDPSAENVKNIAAYTSAHLGLLISYQPDAKLPEGEGFDTGLVWESEVAKRLAGEVRGTVRRPFTLHMDFREKRAEVDVQLDNGLLEVKLPQRRLFSSSGYIFLLWMMGVSLILLIVAVLFMRNQIRPIRRLAIAAERFGKGRDVPSFKPTGSIEVRQAAESFLDMRRRLQRQISQRTEMLAGVSHDLRTPLTRLKLQVEMLGDSPDVDAMKHDIADMEKMINGYLDFVRGQGDEKPEQTDIDELLTRVVTSARRQGIEINADIATNLYMIVRPMALERCLNNIINNGHKYGGNIWLKAYRDEDRLEIVIDDDGPGLTEEQYEEVFKPFYRVEGSRNAATGGIGLGLPIAMDIVHVHGGKIWLEGNEHGGLRVVIRLPI